MPCTKIHNHSIKIKLSEFLEVALSIAIISIHSFVSCEKSDIGTDGTPRKSDLETKYLDDVPVKVRAMDNGNYLFEGDMALPKNSILDSPGTFNPMSKPDAPKARSASEQGVRLWTNNTVVYKIAAGVSDNNKNALQIAMEEMSRLTNIKFKVRANEANYVTVKQNTEGYAWATLGMDGRWGEISLPPNSDKGLILHEIGHTLGLIHEHTRPDRDNHVKIYWHRIPRDWRDQYYKNNFYKSNGTSFDVNSIMMYDGYSYTGDNDKPIMTTKNGNTIPYISELSPLDIKGINNMYGGATSTSGNICAGVRQWQSGVQYWLWAKVIYNGSLYQLTRSGWKNKGRCN